MIPLEEHRGLHYVVRILKKVFLSREPLFWEIRQGTTKETAGRVDALQYNTGVTSARTCIVSAM